MVRVQPARKNNENNKNQNPKPSNENSKLFPGNLINRFVINSLKSNSTNPQHRRIASAKLPTIHRSYSKYKGNYSTISESDITKIPASSKNKPSRLQSPHILKEYFSKKDLKNRKPPTRPFSCYEKTPQMYFFPLKLFPQAKQKLCQQFIVSQANGLRFLGRGRYQYRKTEFSETADSIFGIRAPKLQCS